MKQTELIMGMPISVEIVDGKADAMALVFDYFRRVDERYSTYKDDSEISRINAGLSPLEWSDEMTNYS
jgi:thiamine biosynthesis lipoprotein